MPFFSRLTILLTPALLSTIPAQARAGQIDRLTREAHRLYAESHDYGAFEEVWEKLKAELKSAGRLQELVWSLRAFDFDKEAGQELNRLKAQLRSEMPVQIRREILGQNPIALFEFQNGLTAVFRPLTATGWQQKPLGLAQEMVAFEVDEALQFGLVPTTVLREHEGRLGTLRAFVPSMRDGDRDYRIFPYDDERLHILDYVLQQIDRHEKNWFLRDGAHLVAIDHFLIDGHPHFANLLAKTEPRSSASPPHSLSNAHRRTVIRLKAWLKSGSYSLPVLRSEVRENLLARVEILLSLPGACEQILISLGH